MLAFQKDEKQRSDRQKELVKKFEKQLDSRIGMTEAQLVSALGPPDGVYEPPTGGRVLTWRSTDEFDLPGRSPLYRVVGGKLRSFGGTEGGSVVLHCAFSYTMSDRASPGEAVAVDASFRGDGCISR